MDWESYKKQCDQPNTFTRWMVEQTLELVDQEGLRQQLKSALHIAPLEKPVDHSGDERTDMIVLTLHRNVVVAILDSVKKAETRGITTTDTRSRGLGGFCAAWGEYLDTLR